jgi:hypothetical protein
MKSKKPSRRFEGVVAVVASTLILMGAAQAGDESRILHHYLAKPAFLLLRHRLQIRQANSTEHAYMAGPRAAPTKRVVGSFSSSGAIQAASGPTPFSIALQEVTTVPCPHCPPGV